MNGWLKSRSSVQRVTRAPCSPPGVTDSNRDRWSTGPKSKEKLMSLYRGVSAGVVSSAVMLLSASSAWAQAAAAATGEVSTTAAPTAEAAATAEPAAEPAPEA